MLEEFSQVVYNALLSVACDSMIVYRMEVCRGMVTEPRDHRTLYTRRLRDSALNERPRSVVLTVDSAGVTASLKFCTIA